MKTLVTNIGRCVLIGIVLLAVLDFFFLINVGVFVMHLFYWAIIALQILLGVYILRDAIERNDLYADIPSWIWSLMATILPVIGVVVYWLLNDSRLRAPRK